MMRDEKKTVIWPVNMDNRKTRLQGRRISKKSSIEAPGIEEIKKAAAELGYTADAEYEKSYPRFWWEKGGRIKIHDLQNKTKNKVIVEIAEHIRKKRSKN